MSMMRITMRGQEVMALNVSAPADLDHLKRSAGIAARDAGTDDVEKFCAERIRKVFTEGFDEDDVTVRYVEGSAIVAFVAALPADEKPGTVGDYAGIWNLAVDLDLIGTKYGDGRALAAIQHTSTATLPPGTARA